MENLSYVWLEYYADKIEALLDSHKLEAVVSNVQVSPRWVRFILDLGYGTKISSVQSLSEELSLVLETPGVRVVRSTRELAIEAPRSIPEPVYLKSILKEISMLPPVTAILGLSSEGEICTLPLMAPEVTHVLIGGATGSGKTELLRTMLLSLALFNRQSQLQMILIDPKRRGFTPLTGLPHLLEPVAHSEESAEALLTYTVEEMERRDKEGAPPTPRIIIAIDEVSDLLSTSGKNIEKLLIRLAQRGREAGFHLILSTQRPSASAVPGSIKANLPSRLVGKVASGQEALTAAGLPGTNAELLAGTGDFIAVTGGQTTRFQAAYTGPSDINHIIHSVSSGVTSSQLFSSDKLSYQDDTYLDNE